MFATALEKVSGQFDRRFLVTSFFPVLVFWSLLLAVWIGTQGDLVATAKAIGDQQVSAATLEVLGFLVLVTFSAIIVDGLQLAILQAFEGYWSFPLSGVLAAFGTRWHRSRLKKLADSGRDEDFERIYFGYPLPTSADKVLPTRLGNVLRAAELYPRDRYRIDAVLLWPRLYWLLPESISRDIAYTRASLDGAVAISALAALFAVISGAYLLAVQADWWLFAACFGGGGLVAGAAYQAALGVAVSYGEQIRSAFDLYRFVLPKQMGLRLPLNAASEGAYWDELDKFLYRSGRQNPSWGMWTYVTTTWITQPPVPTAAPTPPIPSVAPPSPGLALPFGRSLLVLAAALTIGGSLLLSRLNAHGPVPVPVTARDLVAYRVIAAVDVTSVPFAARAVPTAAVRESTALEGRYALDAVPAGTPFPADRLGPPADPARLANTVAAAIPATPAMLLGGTLRPGDVVDLVVVQPSKEGQAATSQTFAGLVVLDVRPAAGLAAPETGAAEQPAMIVLALPLDRRDEFARACVGAAIVLTRKT